MTRPTTRVLAALELLQSRSQIGGAELAEKLGVDRRTVRRYIQILEQLGIPIMTEQGRHGGYRLVSGFKLPPMMFTNEETLAISLGLLSARQLGLNQSLPAISSVQAKLERVMPDKLKNRARAISQTTRILLPRREPSLDDNALEILTSATESGHAVGFTYHSPDDSKAERELDPYGLVYRQGRWYVTGRCHLREALRSFRLDRISSVHALPVSFVRPADFDAADFLQQSLLAWGQTYAVSVTLHTDQATLTSLVGKEGFCASRPEQTEDGLRLDTHVDSLDWFAYWLAQLPFSFAINSPDELREAVRNRAQQLLMTCESFTQGTH